MAFDVEAILDDYMAHTAKNESSGNAYIKNPQRGQSASGLYQFTKDTWRQYGGRWGNDPSQAFGGYRPSVAEQNQVMRNFTRNNAKILARGGAEVNRMSLAAAHFLGAGGALNVFRRGVTDNMSARALVGEKAYRANKPVFDKHPTVGAFKQWLNHRSGGGGADPASSQYSKGAQTFNTAPASSIQMLQPIQSSVNGLQPFNAFAPIQSQVNQINSPQTVQPNSPQPTSQNGFNMLRSGVAIPYGGEGVFKKLGFY